jgi:hypothetical protein
MLKKGMYQDIAKKKHKPIKKIDLKSGAETYYECVTKAAEENGFDRSYIAQTAKGKYKQAYGYKWEFI